jgi:hypothetical protein
MHKLVERVRQGSRYRQGRTDAEHHPSPTKDAPFPFHRAKEVSPVPSPCDDPPARCDLRIAATALVQDLTLITRNQKDFARIPGPRIEDWSVA